MPAAFDKCIADGGKVITKKVNSKQYIHVCYPKGGGASVSGEVKNYKKILKSKK